MPTSPPPGLDSDSITVIFQDDFEDGVLDGWNVELAWSLEDSEWVTDSPWSFEEDGGDLVLNSQVSPDSSAWAEVGDRTFGDFTLQAQVELLEGGANLQFRYYEGDGNRGFYNVTLGSQHIGLGKERNDENWDLTSAEPDLNYGQWYTLAVTAEGGAITITLDGAPVLSYQDTDDPILSGRIAFSTWGHLHLDDVAIWLDIPSSDAVTWSPTAPMPAGGVWAISVAASDPDIIYLATRMNNAFRSEDGGRTWTPKAQLGAHIFAPIAVHPTNPDIIYVSNGVVHRSDNGGDTLVGQSIGSGDTMGVQAIAIYEADPDIVYAGDDTGTVYKTGNGGQDWNAVGVLQAALNVRTLLIDPTDSDKLFAAVQDAGIYTSANGGVSWSRVLSISPTDQSLVMDPTDPDRLYAADGDTIYRTADGGVTWTPLASSPPALYLAIATTGPAVLYVSGADGVLRSNDGGESWSPTGYDASVFDWLPALAVSPADADVVYAGVEGGVVLSTDGGATWSWSNDGLADLDAWQLAVSPTDSDRLYAGTFCMRGIFQTTDAGSTWVLAPEHFHYVMEIASVPLQPEVLYVTHHDGLHRSLDGGSTWRHVPDTGYYHLHGLAVDPVNPDVAYVGSVGGVGEYSAPYATIYKTTDGGASWTEINNGFPMAATSVYVIAIDPTSTDTVYVATYREGLSHTRGSGIGIYKSTDGGESWTPINQGLTTSNVATLALDPFDPQTLYAGTDRGLFVTTNGGEEWMLVGEAPAILINAIVPDPTAPGTWYITTEWAGVFRTTDGGESWVSLNQGLPLLPIGDLILDTARGVLYVAVRGAGVYKGVVVK
ncbi:MAG: family 16 glycoside hydrolase [Dehalococcoidia bacterium]